MSFCNSPSAEPLAEHGCLETASTGMVLVLYLGHNIPRFLDEEICIADT